MNHIVSWELYQLTGENFIQNIFSLRLVIFKNNLRNLA